LAVACPFSGVAVDVPVFRTDAIRVGYSFFEAAQHQFARD
jgi:hypothetical protein